MNGYHTRGAIPFLSHAYVSREFERAALRSIFADRWALVLGPRQHGKTTSLIRVLHELQEGGYLCAMIDLQAKPLCQSYDHFLAWLASEVAKSLKTEIGQTPSGIYSTSVIHWLSSVVPPGTQRVVLIVDEASAIGHSQWLENFYGQLRSIYNKRAGSQPAEVSHRLQFIFAGTFLPEYLISNTQNSPFNVCERIYTNDLGLDQCCELQRRVEGFVQESVIKRIYEVVGGQPYLLQVILNSLSQVEPDARIVELENRTDDLLSDIDDHLVGIFERFQSRPTLERIVAQMLQNVNVDIDPSDSDYRYLQVIGLASAEGSKLRFRNAIYRQAAYSYIRGRKSEPAMKENCGGINQARAPDASERIVVLFLSSDPSDAARLRVGEELREIQEKLQLAKQRDRFLLYQQTSVRPADVSQALLDRQPHIVQFSGHGMSTGELWFEDQMGGIHPVEPDTLAALFEQFSNHVKCVVLNACYSAAQANAIASCIDNVIGMNQPIGDEAAIAFSIGFYQALGAGRQVEEAYKLGCVQIRLRNLSEYQTPILVKRHG